MASGQLNPLLRQIRRLSGPLDGERGDGRLLERFLAQRDEAAFAALVQRHGPMVFGLCNRVLHNEHDAEDVFQATFLVLARKAASLRNRASLGGWLHEVAYHIALRARATAMRRQARERHVRAMAPAEEPTAELIRRELRPLLDEELRQLPDKYREPLILCYLEGKTSEAAARQLGWPIGSMSRRLARGRELLRRRLVRRGITFTTGPLPIVLSDATSSAAIPPVLTASVVRMALQATTEIPASVASLADGSIRQMFLTKVRLALFLALTLVGAGAGAFAYKTSNEQDAVERSTPTANAADKPSPTDFYGDPLPPGALARLGTIRLRHVSAMVTFSPDGKELISAGEDGTLRYWEPITGKEKCRARLQDANSLGQPLVFAADGKSVAGCASGNLYVWDTATGKARKRFPVGNVSIPGLEHIPIQVIRLALSRDGKLLAAVFYDLKTHDIHLWDVSTGKELVTLKRPQFSDNMAFSPDGKLLATVAHGEGLRLWETANGKEIRKIAGAQGYGLAFSPHGKWVAARNQDGGVKVWNVADGKEVFAVKTGPGRYPYSLAFAPDNRILAISFSEGLELYDITTGKQVRTIPECGGLVFSPDGQTVVCCGTAIHLHDLGSGKEIGPRAGHEGAVTSLAVSPDGHGVATFSNHDRKVRLWDAATGRLLFGVNAHRYYARAGAFTADGRFLVTGGGENVLRLWDRKSGAELRTFTVESADPARENLQIMGMALSSDGERLVSLVVGGDIRPTYQVYVWDMATGKRLARRALRDSGFGICFSSDARSLANPGAKEVVVEDTVTGQEIVKAAGRMPLAYSPDGQILATTLYKPIVPPPGQPGVVGNLPENAEAILLTELATGKQLARIETGPGGFALLAYSSDCRTLATADKDGFRLWDAATGKEVFRRPLPEKLRSFGYSFAESLAFFPGGDRLATGLRDSTVLIWDLEPKSRHKGIPVHDLAPHDLERLWIDLGGDDAAKAHRAEWTLAAVPERAVPFLNDRLRPASALDEKQVQGLIADLDSAQFESREKATKKLASFGEQVEPALRQALDAKPALEARKRLELLHKDADIAGRGIVRSPEVLRTLRAIRALEHMRTSEARLVLEKLAAGDPAARSTRNAKEALRRLSSHPAPGEPGDM